MWHRRTSPRGRIWPIRRSRFYLRGSWRDFHGYPFERARRRLHRLDAGVVRLQDLPVRHRGHPPRFEDEVNPGDVLFGVLDVRAIGISADADLIRRRHVGLLGADAPEFSHESPHAYTRRRLPRRHASAAATGTPLAGKSPP